MSHDDFPSRARAERKRQGLTQKQLAEMASMSHRAIQTFEGRTAETTPANRRAIAEALGLDEDGDDTAVNDDPFAEFPRTIRTFLLMMGAYLMTKPEEHQEQVIYDLTRQIFEERR